MNVVKMPKYPCTFCRKNEATQLCDFVVGYSWTTMKKDGRMIGGHHETCDNEVCKECVTNHAGFEFCPSCEKLHQYVQKNRERRPRKMMIDMVMGNFEPQA